MKRIPTLLAALALSSGIARAETVTYDIVFDGTWSAKTHPTDFPLLAHFSPIIGASHAEGWTLFHPGQAASDGLEKLAEEGKHQPLDGEIRAAIASGLVLGLVETSDPIRFLPGQAMTTITVDDAHPMVSIVAMIAPSPDWFAGAMASLRDGSGWVREKTVELLPYDAGTDGGTTYRASDMDIRPRQPIRLADAKPLQPGGATVPVGRLILRRK